MKKSVIPALLLACCGIAATASARQPQNIIFLIGDGMGPAYTTAYRYYMAEETGDVSPTIFDDLLTGMAGTYPDDDTRVTDSAASATALATGRKTYNGAIGIDRDHRHLPSLLSEAKSRGYTTGIVVTSQINHATPASFLAHNESRRNYDAIADDYLGEDGRSPVADLLLGGGTSYFIRPDNNLVKVFQQQGYQYLNQYQGLKQLTIPALGLFAPKGLAPALGSDHPHRLANMTAAALKALDQQAKPYVLMIEASQIDWCGHANDIACAMAEMDDFAHTMKLVKEYVDAKEDTLMVATADHSTGGLTLGKHGVYQWKGPALKKVSVMPEQIAQLLKESPEDLENIVQTHTGLTLTAVQRPIFLQALKDPDDTNVEQLAQLVKHLIDEATYTGWTTSGHDAIDVQIFAHGPQAEQFRGFMDNTQIGKKLISLLQPIPAGS